jgi:uncharacterized protein (PEP-CTERM system associated)
VKNRQAFSRLDVRLPSRLTLLAAMLMSSFVHAQSSEGSVMQSLGQTRVSGGSGDTPYRGELGIRASEIYTDNVSRQSTHTVNDWVTEVSPYVNYYARGARSNSVFNARLQNWLHSDGQTGNSSNLQLNAATSLEAYEDHFFIDAGLVNDRQRTSQFKAADASYGGTNNSTQVTRFSVSPYLLWHVGEAADAALHYHYEKLHSEASYASGSNESASFDIHNTASTRRLGWALNASHYAVNSESSNAGTTNGYSGSLLYGLTPALLASLSGGQEFENFRTGQRRHSWYWGGGLRWQPDERTTISAQTSKRFFGRGFNYLLSERFERSALQWSYSRELSTSSSTAPLGQAITLTNGSLSRYAAEYNAESAALESSIPDKVQRDRVVKERLAARGISIFDLQQLDYLSGQASINRNMRLAWVLTGVRNSLTVSGHKSDREAVSQQQIGLSDDVIDDLTTHQSVKEHGWDAVWRHSLTSLTSLGVRYAFTDASGVTVNGQLDSSRTNNVGVNVDTSLAPFTTGGVTFNYSRSTGTVEYREKSVAVYLNHRF